MGSTISQNVYLQVPVSDMKFFKALAKKMGWKVDERKSFLNSYLASRPKDVDLTDADIVSEVESVRYK